MIGIGYTIEGCESRDTIQLIPYDQIFLSEVDTFTCENELLLLDNALYPPDTTIMLTLYSLHSCDSLVTYHITTAACLGDTLWHDQTPILSGDTAQIHYTNVQGCDSIIQVAVAALQPVAVFEKQEICIGESSLIFGNIETEAGIYSQRFAAENSCDSLHQIELLFYPKIDAEVNIVPTCEGESIGQATLNIFSAAEPISYQWSIENPDIPSVENLPAGNHNITLTDANSCTEIIPFSIPIYEETQSILICEPQLYAPNVFSPNGDGINDFFYLQSNERVLSITKLRIFDRFGELIFEQKEFLPNSEELGWDGLYRGEMMNPQVFVWQAEARFLSGVVEVFYGGLVLVR